MSRRLISTLLVCVMLITTAFVPVAVLGQSNLPPAQFVLRCNESGSAYFTVSNLTVGTPLFAVLISLSSSGNRVEASFGIPPLGQREAIAQRNAAPQNGYQAIVYNADNGEVILNETRSAGNCSSDKPNTLDPLPTFAVLTLTPTPDWWGGSAPTPTPTPISNSFRVTMATRTCEDQSFVTAWTGSNIKSLQLSLSNTSDEWTSGWQQIDPAPGSTLVPVDHHNYDKAVFEVTFVDGTVDTQYFNLGNCSDTTPQVPEVPTPLVPGTDGPSKESGQTVTALPSTGTGSSTNMMIIASALVLGACALVVTGSIRKLH